MATIRKIIIASFVFLLVNSGPSLGESLQSKQEEQPFRVLPHAGIMMDYSIIDSDAGFTGKQTKTLDLLLFGYKLFNVSLFVNEDIFTSRRHSSSFYPYRIAYTMDFAYLSYTIGRSQIGIVLDHICYNTFDKPIRNAHNELRWYGVGIKWQTTGMQIGRKNISISSSPSLFDIHNLHYSFYVGYPFFSKIPEYKYISRFAVRYDFPIFSFGIPYLEAQFKGLVYPDNETAVDRFIEAGVRIPFSSVYFMPYCSYGYMNDSLFPGIADTQAAAGMRVESLIGNSYYGDAASIPAADDIQASMHVYAGYAKILRSDHYNFITNIGATIRSSFYKYNTLYFSSYIDHSSKDEPTALYPRFINLLFVVGYDRQMFPNTYLTMAVQHYGRHDGNEFRGKTENYLGVQLAGQFFFPLDGPAIPLYSVPASIPQDYLSVDVGTVLIVKEENYPYDVIMHASISYYFSSFSFGKPYIKTQIQYYAGSSNDYEYTLEHGIVFTSALPMTLYYALTRDIDIDKVNGAQEYHHLCGIRLRI